MVSYPPRQLLNKAVGLGNFCSPDNLLLGRAECTVGNVLCHGGRGTENTS